MSSIIVRNLSEQLVELVRDRILSGKVAADLAIRQDALAAELGVSKIPLREALTRLEQEGLIRSQANRGYFVRSLSTQEAEEVYALRLKLEPEAVALAAVEAKEEEQAAARQALEALDRVTEAHGESVGAFNRAFHLALVRPAIRPITFSIIERLHILSERYVRKHLEPSGRDERANDEHRRMLETWLARDGKAAAALTRTHIEQTLKDLRRQLSAERKDKKPE
ncbi:GntR family transcriptional regulator [Allosphingosinicella sp.]|uniref:GntR family transcriptional regulator n=1 Tax=Allosphingosinicella sp. TaxID=2823234 RepID=UPI002FC1CC70